MSYPYPYDPARAAAAYYVAHPQAPPAGYPPSAYPPQPTSPSQPPARPHTTAPFPNSQFAPPPPGGVYYVPNGHAPPTPGAAPPSSAAYPPQTPASAHPAPAGGFSNFSPEQLQGMIDQLKDLKAAKTSPQANSVAPAPAEGSPPRIDTSVGGPPPANGAVPQSARGPPYPYSAYPQQYPKAASHNGEVSSNPNYPYGHASSQSKGNIKMPGSFFDSAAPPQAPIPPSKTPAPQSRPEVPRKVSEQTSEISFASSKSHDMAQAWEHWGGSLVETVTGREPRPKPKLVSLFRGIAAYMIALLEPSGSCVVTLNKLIQFYNTFPVGENEPADWNKFFHNRSPKVLSELFCALNVEHHLVPSKPNQRPHLPGLTPRGFEVWMFTQLMAAPSREHHRLSKILEHWTIFEHGVEMPRLIPRDCFPQREDRQIYNGWWVAVREDYPEDPADSEEEHKAPLGLPEPESKPGRGRGHSLRGGEIPFESATEQENKEPSTAPAPSLHRQRTARPYATTNVVPDPHDFLTQSEKESPPGRYPQPYGSIPNPGWKDDVGRREDVNPRPTLGEEPRPARSRSVKPKGTSKDASSRRGTAGAAASKRGRSMHRRREESPDRYHSSDEYDDGYGKRYEGDGLYESLHVVGYGATANYFDAPAADSWALSRYDDPPPSSHYHAREPSRGPPKSRPAPPPEKDIREYTYQEQYEKDYAPTVSASGRGAGRPHRSSDAYAHPSRHGDRRSGQWR